MTEPDHLQFISQNDFSFLVMLGDTWTGYIARGEYAEMANVPVEQVDKLVLHAIYGEDSN